MTIIFVTFKTAITHNKTSKLLNVFNYFGFKCTVETFPAWDLGMGCNQLQ